MPRRRQPSLKVDMFPFLSVLCSVIGVLMLFMMIIISTRVIEAEEQTTTSKPEGEVGVEDGIDAESYRRLEAEIDEKAALLAERHQERDRLLKKYRELIELIEEKKDLLAQPANQPHNPPDLDRPDPIAVIPDETHQVKKTAIFVEVKAEGYLRQPDEKLFAPITKKKVGKEQRMFASKELEQFISKVDENRSRQYLLLLVHPNGVEAYSNLQEYLQKRFNGRIDKGLEPFSRDWKLISKQQQP